jgi:NADPH:quinone reductase-like Zn-dependent oxidoreductase
MKRKRVVLWSALAIVAAVPLAACVAYWTSDNTCSDHETAAPSHPVQAVVYCDYGSPRVLTLAGVEKPVLGDSEVLVRVRAASVNPLDWHFMEGTPYFARLTMGLRRPKVTRLGVDFAGTIESVGKNVTRFKVGDDVFGGRTGAFAQYLLVRDNGALVPKPANVTFEQAAAVPVAGITALQGLRDQGHVQPGQSVLINGASGGVGTFAVQLAKSFGAHVTGVCSTANVAMVRSIGADEVIDYKKDDFTRGVQRYDLIIDNVGNHSLSELRHVLKPMGTYVMIGGPAGQWVDPLPRMLSALVVSPFVSQPMRFFIAELNAKDLTFLGDLMQAGKVTPVVDRRYPLRDVAAAMQYLEAGHARGKVVITMD